MTALRNVATYLARDIALPSGVSKQLALGGRNDGRGCYAKLRLLTGKANGKADTRETSAVLAISDKCCQRDQLAQAIFRICRVLRMTQPAMRAIFRFGPLNPFEQGSPFCVELILSNQARAL